MINNINLVVMYIGVHLVIFPVGWKGDIFLRIICEKIEKMSEF